MSGRIMSIAAVGTIAFVVGRIAMEMIVATNSKVIVVGTVIIFMRLLDVLFFFFAKCIDATAICLHYDDTQLRPIALPIAF